MANRIRSRCVYIALNTATVLITVADLALVANETTLVIFQFNQAVTGFSNSDIITTNGLLSQIINNGDGSFSAFFTASNNTNSSSSITVNLTGIEVNHSSGGINDSVILESFMSSNTIIEANFNSSTLYQSQ